MGWYSYITIYFQYDSMPEHLLKKYILTEKGYETGFDTKRHVSCDEIFYFINTQMSDINCMFILYF